VFWFVQDLVKRMTGAKGGWRWVGLRMPATPPFLAAHGGGDDQQPMAAGE
jgi:hypothetical protein